MSYDALKVTRARGSPLLVAFQASAIRSSATTVTRSPLPTDAAVRSARGPKAITLTQRVTLSAPGVQEGGNLEGEPEFDARWCRCGW